MTGFLAWLALGLIVQQAIADQKPGVKRQKMAKK